MGHVSEFAAVTVRTKWIKEIQKRERVKKRERGRGWEVGEWRGRALCVERV